MRVNPEPNYPIKHWKDLYRVVLALILLACSILPNLLPTQVQIGNFQFGAGVASAATWSVGANADDGYRDNGGNFYNTGTYANLGNYFATFDIFVRFSSVTIPQGSHIDTAKITFKNAAAQAGDTCKANIYAEDAGNATAVTSSADWTSRAKTTAIPWNPIEHWHTAGGSYDTPSLISVVQAVVNRADFTSGNAIQFFIHDDSSSGSALRQPYTRDAGSSYAAVLTVTYSIVAPTITTSAATSVTYTTATLNGNVTATGGNNPTVIVYWGGSDGGTTPGNWANSTAPTSPSQPQGVAAFYYNATGLPPGEIVYFIAAGTNSGGTSWGTTQSFVTPSPLIIGSMAATSVGNTTARFNGNVTSVESGNVTEIGFVWSTTSHSSPGNISPTSQTVYSGNWTDGGGDSYGNGSTFYYDASGLNPGTLYYVRPAGYNPDANYWSYGNELTVRTYCTIAATVQTLAVTNLTFTTVTFNGNITNGCLSTVGFRYGTTDGGPYPLATPTTSDCPSVFSVDVCGLRAFTRYYVQAVATNGNGTTYGNQVSFTTPPILSTPRTGFVESNPVMLGSDRYVVCSQYLEPNNIQIFSVDETWQINSASQLIATAPFQVWQTYAYTFPDVLPDTIVMMGLRGGGCCATSLGYIAAYNMDTDTWNYGNISGYSWPSLGLYYHNGLFYINLYLTQAVLGNKTQVQSFTPGNITSPDNWGNITMPAFSCGDLSSEIAVLGDYLYLEKSNCARWELWKYDFAGNWTEIDYNCGSLACPAGMYSALTVHDNTLISAQPYYTGGVWGWKVKYSTDGITWTQLSDEQAIAGSYEQGLEAFAAGNGTLFLVHNWTCGTSGYWKYYDSSGALLYTLNLQKDQISGDISGFWVEDNGKFITPGEDPGFYSGASMGMFNIFSPSVGTLQTGMTYISSGNPTTNYSGKLVVKSSASDNDRGLLHFCLPELSTDSTILSATLSAKPNNILSYGATLLGNTSVGTTTELLGYLYAQQYTAAANGTATAVYVYGQYVGDCEIAIYSDAGNNTIGNLLSGQPISTPTMANTWTAIPLGNSVSIVSGTKYWVLFSNDMSCIDYSATSSLVAYSNNVFYYNSADFPSDGSFGFTYATANKHYNIFVPVLQNPYGRTVDVYQLSQTNWTQAGATYNKYDGVNNWISAGGDYTGSASNSTVPNFYSTAQTWDITDIVQNIVSGNTLAVDVLLKDNSESSATNYNWSYDPGSVYLLLTVLQVSPNSYDFGSVQADTSYPTSTGYFTLQNILIPGAQDVDVQISTTDLVGAGTTWTASDMATQGIDQFGVRSSNGTGAFGIIAKRNSTYNTLITALAPGNVTTLEIELLTPTNYTTGDAKSGNVSLIAYPTGGDPASGNATMPIAVSASPIIGNITNLTSSPNCWETSVEWTKAMGTNYSVVRVSTSSYPTDPNGSDGSTLWGNTTGNTTSHSTTPCTTYYISAWGYDTYSDTYSTSPAHEIAAYNPGLPSVSTLPATLVEETTATLNGNVTAATCNVDGEGFVYDTASRSAPGNITPASSGYANYWPNPFTTSGNITPGAYIHAFSLSPGTLYYDRAVAHSCDGYSYGDEAMLLTLPGDPSSLTITGHTNNSLDISFTKGTNADRTVIRYDTSGCPTTYNDGTLGGNVTETTATISSLNPNQIYYIRIWSWTTAGGLEQYSSGYASATDYTSPSDVTNFTSTAHDGTSVSLEWTAPIGEDQTKVLGKEGSYPSGPTDGSATVVYLGTGNSTTHSGLIDCMDWYYAAYGYGNASTYYSDNAAQFNQGTTCVPPTVVTDSATNVEETTATLWGNVTDVGSSNVKYTGHVWGTTSQAAPSGAPNTGLYDYNWTSASGNSTAGAFSHNISTLAEGELYYTRFGAKNNSPNWSWGDELTFLTKPLAPTGCSLAQGDAHLELSWAKGTGADKTVIVRKEGSYPANRADGTEVYNDTGTYYDDTGLTNGHDYYYRLWSWASEGGLEQYSDSYCELNGTPHPIPAVTTNAASSVEETTATLNATITNDQGGVLERGFEWDIDSSGAPYAYSWTESGSWGNVSYDYSGGTYPKGTCIYVRAKVRNLTGWGYGSEVIFLTKPDEPTALADTAHTYASITMGWTNGDGADGVILRYRTDTYPTSYSDGTLAYQGAGASHLESLATPGQIYYWRIWSYSTCEGLTQYSDTYSQHSAYTSPAASTGFNAHDPTTTSILLDWTLGTGGDKTLIMGKIGSYPVSTSDGTQVYWGIGVSTTHSVPICANNNKDWYYSAWAYDSDSGDYSDSPAQDEETTLTDTPTVTNGLGVTDITNTSARLNGELICDGGETTTAYIYWGDNDGATTPGFWDNEVNLGTTTIGVFYTDLSELVEGITCYYRCRATNVQGTSWSSATLSFLTVCLPPGNLTVVQNGDYQFDITWTQGVVGGITAIRLGIDNPPDSATDGTPVYEGTGNSTSFYFNTMCLSGNLTFRGWGHCGDSYSGSYDEDSILLANTCEGGGNITWGNCTLTDCAGPTWIQATTTDPDTIYIEWTPGDENAVTLIYAKVGEYPQYEPGKKPTGTEVFCGIGRSLANGNQWTEINYTAELKQGRTYFRAWTLCCPEIY